MQNEHLFNCCADQWLLSVKRNQDCSHFHINSFNSSVQTFKCEIVVPLVKSFQSALHIIPLTSWGEANSLLPLCPCPHFTHLLNFQVSTYSFPAILSCCLEVSQGTHKATSLSSVSSSVKMFFRYPQKILATGKLWDHDLSYCQIFCWILFCHSCLSSFFFFHGIGTSAFFWFHIFLLCSQSPASSLKFMKTVIILHNGQESMK